MKSVATYPQRVALAGIIALIAVAFSTHLSNAQTPLPTPTPTLTLTPQPTGPAGTATSVAQTPVPTATATAQPVAGQPTIAPTTAVQAPAAGAQATVGPQIVVLTATPVAQAISPTAQTTSTAQTSARLLNSAGVNLITNPGHEHPGTNFAGRGDVNVTWNWNPFWEDPPAGADRNDPNYRTPEFQAMFARDNADRVRSQAGSDRWRNTVSVNKRAGIMQFVADLPVGAPVRFTSWLQLWSNDNDTITPEKSATSDLKVRVCIDQDGGPRDLTDPNLVCSDWAQPRDKFVQLTVDGVAKNSAANAIIWSTADTPILHNDVYADESCFEILPAAGAKGICAGAGLIETGPNVPLLPANVGDIKITPEQQAQLAKALAGTGIPSASAAAAAAVPSAGALTAPEVISPSLAVNARVFMNVRQQPSQTAAVATTAKRGAVLPVLGKTEDSKWFQIEIDGQTGWVLGSLTLPNAAAKGAPVVP